jgi:hypothetical protein
MMTDTDDSLLKKINTAVAEHNTAEQAVTTAESAVTTAVSELTSKSMVVGQLLLEAKKRHPKKADFEAFLNLVIGLGRSRAYECMRIAGGGTTEEQSRKRNRERQRKHREAKKKLPKAKPQSKPDPKHESVTETDVTESAKRNLPFDISKYDQALKRAQNAALGTEVPPEPTGTTTTGTTTTGTTTTPLLDFDRSTAAKRSQGSRDPLNEFKYACKTWLPQIADEADRQEALRFAAEMLAGKNAEAA